MRLAESENRTGKPQSHYVLITFEMWRPKVDQETKCGASPHNCLCNYGSSF